MTTSIKNPDRAAPEFELEIRGTRYFLRQGDLTLERADAIVNAANSGLMGGGGVDGAIHRRGGPSILDECKRIVAERGRCAPGKAVLTGGGELAAKYVIHTVGPMWKGGAHGEIATLRRCYESSLSLAKEHGIRTIAFPSISTGAYRFPLNDAAMVAQNAIIDFLSHTGFERVGFVLFDGSTFDAYHQALKLLVPRGS